MYGHRRNAVPVDWGSGSGTRRTQSGSSHSTQTLAADSGSSHGTQSSSRSSFPPQITRWVPSRPTKCPRRSTLQTTAYTEHLGRLKHHHKLRQFVLAMIAGLSTRTRADMIKLNHTQNQTQKTMIFQMTTWHQGLVTAHELRTDDKQPAGLRRCEFPPPRDRGHTPAAPRRIIQGSAYTPPTFTSSSVPP